MKSEIKLIQIMDLILEWFSQRPQNYITEQEAGLGCHKYIASKLNISEKDERLAGDLFDILIRKFSLILEQLDKEEYIRKGEVPNTFCVTLKGILFIESGGYSFINENVKRETERNRSNLYFNGIVATGVLAAYIYYDFEIISNYNKLNCCEKIIFPISAVSILIIWSFSFLPRLIKTTRQLYNKK